MKTKILKLVLPAFVLMLAVGSAYAFKFEENKALLAPKTGWINLPGEPCAIEVQCSDTPSDQICTAIHNGNLYQAFGKNNPQIMICIQILFRI
jgi:hypothetical protein